MDLQRLLNSRRSGILALWVSRALPPRMGLRLADLIADRIAASQEATMVRSIRANQWMVSGRELTGEALDRAVWRTVRHMARSFYTLFHYMEDLDNFQKLVELDDRSEEVILRSQEASQGLIVLGLHMGGFDLVLQAAARLGLRALALSVPQPDEAVEWQHEYRQRAGLEILPATMSSIRQAIDRLKAGETVLTGLDRPMPDAKYRPRFFGHPANVPVHYIQLALRSEAPLVVMASIEGENGLYRILTSDYIHLDHHSDRREEIIQNAEAVLRVAEGFICLAPEQWSISQPVWPELQAQVP